MSTGEHEVMGKDVLAALWLRRFVFRNIAAIALVVILGYFTLTAVQAQRSSARSVALVAQFISSDAALRTARADASDKLGQQGKALAFCATTRCAARYVALSAQARIKNAADDTKIGRRWEEIAKKICKCEDPGGDG